MVCPASFRSLVSQTLNSVNIRSGSSFCPFECHYQVHRQSRVAGSNGLVVGGACPGLGMAR
jgi:hypothetical protein